MPEEIVSSSQTETSQTVERDAETEALFEAFNIKPSAAKKEIKFPEAGAIQSEDETEEPAIVQEDTSTPTDSKKLKVKFNKEEIEVDEDKIPEYVQKGLALDKEREKNKQSQTDLDRAAKLLGYKDHADLSAGLDALEQQQQQKKQTELDELREDMLLQLEANGVDRAKAEQWINSHPLIKQGEEAIANQQKVTAEQAEASRWKPLYDAFPDIQALAQKGDFSWYTPEFAELAKRNDPLLAYEHLNKDTVQTQTKKQLEQKLIKQQQLGNRSNTLGNTQTEEVTSTLLPAQRALAEMFGVSEAGVEKQQKLINSRR